MSDDQQNPYLLYPEREQAKRVRYYDGQFLKADDFLLAQSHPIDRRRRMQRWTMTAGVVYGFGVHGEKDAVVVVPGTALDDEGRQMVLTQNARRQIQQADRGKNLSLWIRYAETASEESDEDKGAAGLTRFDETPTIDYTPDGGALPDGVLVIARLQVDGSGNVTADTSGRPRAGLRIPGRTGLTLTSNDADPGRGTLVGALQIEVPDGTAYSPTAPALDVVGHGRVRGGMTIGQTSNVGYQGVVNDGNDLVVNGQIAAGGSGGAAMYSLGIGHPAPQGKEGTLTTRKLAVGTTDPGNYALHVTGTTHVEGYMGVGGTFYGRNDIRVGGALDTGINAETREENNGKIVYQRWTDGLDIVGAGTDMASRKITFHAQGGSRFIGDLKVEDDLVATRDITANRNMRAKQDMRVDRNIRTYGQTRTQTLRVDGGTTFVNASGTGITLSDRLTSENLTINNHAALNNVAVGGTTTFNGNVTVNGGTMTVQVQANLNANVRVNGGELYVANRLCPSAGSGANNGIVWPANPGGGSGDQASIRYYAASGEDTRFVFDAGGSDNEDWMVFRQDGGEKIVLRDGKIAINHNNPSRLLDVNGETRIRSHLFADNQLHVGNRIRPSTGTGNNKGICWDDNAFGGSGDFARIQYFSHGGENTKLQIATGNDGNDWIVLHQQGGERLVVRNGRVGINTNNPSHSFDVSGNMRARNNVRVDGFIDLSDRDGNNVTGNSGQIKYKVHTNNSLEILGAATNTSGSTRKITMWSEAGLHLHGWAKYTGELRLHNDDNERALVSRNRNTRVIWGAVKSNGTRWVGEGFTCSRYGNHTGVFKIDFSPHFSSRPAVVVTQHYPTDNDGSNSWGNTKDNAVVARCHSDWCIIVTGEGDGDRKYRSFEFIAIGPR